MTRTDQRMTLREITSKTVRAVTDSAVAEPQRVFVTPMPSRWPKRFSQVRPGTEPSTTQTSSLALSCSMTSRFVPTLLQCLSFGCGV